jgi:hypothetical protein
LYGFETLNVIKTYKLQVFENKEFRNVFEPKKYGKYLVDVR